MNTKKPKNFFAAALAAVTLASMGGAPVMASFEVINEQTGFASVNTTTSLFSTQFQGFNDNLQELANWTQGAATTGYNELKYNLEGGDLFTGLVGLAGNVENEINVNAIAHAGTASGGLVAANLMTGAESVNLATGSYLSRLRAENKNVADVENGIRAEGNSGYNLIKGNTGLGYLKTGDVTGVIKTENAVNSNFIDLLSFAPAGALVAAGNKKTGYASLNTASALLAKNMEVENENCADIENDIYVKMNSGHNASLYNNADPIKTGDAGATLVVKNNANSNVAKVKLDMSGAKVLASNEMTGAESVNNAFASVLQNVRVKNINKADIENEVDVSANSGYNTLKGNSGPGLLETGDALNSVKIENNANQNLSQIEIGGPAVVAAANAGTGFDSVNNSVASSIVDVQARNRNELELENEVESKTNTGHNDVMYNTGSGAVATGDASSEVAIENNVNTNITAVKVALPAEVAAVNEKTGAESVNNASAVAVVDVSVVNTNEAEISNNVDSSSNTGGNVVVGNNGGGDISTGSAALSIGVSNTGNINATAVTE